MGGAAENYSDPKDSDIFTEDKLKNDLDSDEDRYSDAGLMSSEDNFGNPLPYFIAASMYTSSNIALVL